MPPEETTYRDGVNQKLLAQDIRMRDFEHRTDGSFNELKEAMVEGFKGMHARQDTTNGRVRWNEKMIWLAIGFCSCVSIIIIPTLFFVASVYFHMV